MGAGDAERVNLAGLLHAVEAAAPIDAVDVLGSELQKLVGAEQVSLLVTNLSGNAVVRLSHVATGAPGRDGRNERGESLPLPGSPYEQVLFSQEHLVIRENETWTVLVPVTERGDAIGLLEVLVAREPDAETIDSLRSAAHSLAYVLIATRRHTDLFEWGQRDVPYSLAAEIQRRLLPSSYTLEAGAFTLAGWLEPAAEAAGDTFDYSLEREYLYASITDAIGHSIESALLATVVVGSFRNSRRFLASPAHQATNANAALQSVARPDQFVTGQIIRIHLADGSFELVNAGHPAPYRLRSGRAVPLDVVPHLPFGITETTYDTQVFTLEPGDRLVFVTDGFLERNASSVDLRGILEATADRHPREVVRELALNVLEATGGTLPGGARRCESVG